MEMLDIDLTLAYGGKAREGEVGGEKNDAQALE
jgi:hypothetical protein